MTQGITFALPRYNESIHSLSKRYALAIMNLPLFMQVWIDHPLTDYLYPERQERDQMQEFDHLVKKGIAIEVPHVASASPVEALPVFIDGRHRTHYLYTLGETELPVLTELSFIPLFVNSGFCRLASREEANAAFLRCQQKHIWKNLFLPDAQPMLANIQAYR